ncbi:MAG: phospholipase D-like domain-containing protein [Nitrosopumilaceae archaeon]
MLEFEFNTKVTDRILTKLLEARKFIRIALFQIHNQLIFDVILKKLEEGVKVEIFTLPYDSINKDVRQRVTERFESIRKKGAILHFCKWNVGDPEGTRTAIGRWYLFHGKFIVTDKAAITLSANFTENPELDVILVFKNDDKKIDEYNRKFDELFELFIKGNLDHSGSIKQKILDTKIPDILKVFELPAVIETEVHRQHWILHYPASMCPINIPISDKLYLTPFDCRGRNFLESIISEASEYVYISTESFTDIDFSQFLIGQSIKGIKIKILSGAESRDFPERIQNMLRDLSAHNVSVRTTSEDLHAKLVLTDKRLVVCSINLNKMNLGFEKTKQYWRENTESINVCSDSKILDIAKERFTEVFETAIPVEIRLAEKMQKLVSDAFSQRFGLKTKKDVKILFSRLIVHKEIEVKKFVTELGQITQKLMKKFNKTIVEKDDFVMALILHHLSERKHDLDQLNEKLSILNTQIDLKSLLANLSSKGFIEKEADFYKLKLDTLLK